MKKVEHIVGSFIDYAGRTRNFVMAAVSLHDENTVYIEEDYEEVLNDMKVLSIGVSVCRPDDIFNEDLGVKIATGKATKYRDHALYATDAGLVNEKMVKALLEQEADYFKVNPGRYLAGYDKDAAKYKKQLHYEEYVEGLDDDELTVFEYLTSREPEELDEMLDAVNHALAE